ncbi:MAG: glutaredoxin 3 [Gammaproteobacteria bacterium]|jgi:glutaredoxin 3|uniref:glutaredoxin 3 n=1 Tax=Nevskia sp. TaxID=1929292 RepID=UPI003F7271A9|nr:glutaredoxin 3 [Gammaproteobacteria bacterium]
MKPVTVYSTRICPYCMMAKRLLTQKGVPYEEILIDGNEQLRIDLMTRTGRRTVPQIYVGDHHVGGFDDLAALERAGQLDPLLHDA